MLETVSKSEVLTEEDKVKLSQFFPDIQTERGLLNVAYRSRAHAYLVNVPGCSWLCDKEKMIAGEKDAWKPTILMELGKIRDIEAMIEIALQICDIKPKQKQGALMVRHARLGKDTGDTVDLANELIHAINNYSDRYEMEPDDILDALQIAYSQTQELKENLSSREDKTND